MVKMSIIRGISSAFKLIGSFLAFYPGTQLVGGLMTISGGLMDSFTPEMNQTM